VTDRLWEIGDKGRYSPAECTGIVKTRIEGNPDMKHVSTSFAELRTLPHQKKRLLPSFSHFEG
jgi:hypothetical protein